MNAISQAGLNATVAHALAAALQRHGVDTVFGQSIPSALFLAAPEFGITQIGYRTENAGGAMADGYARISHKVGVVAAQNGPAATLLVAPLAEALKASVPIVAIVQEVARSGADRNAFQELDHIALFQACAKWIRRVEDASRLDDYVDQAFTAAASGRPGPAVLLVRMDMLRQPAAASGPRSAQLGNYPLDRAAPGPDRIRQAADMLATAKRPLIIAGGGVHLSDAAAEVAALGNLTGIPVATTNMGKGSVDERGPLSLGVFGNCMGPRSLGEKLRHFVTDADVILLAGTRTNQNGTDSWQLYPPTAQLIHVDVDPMEVGRNYEAFRLVGDVKLTLQLLRANLSGRDLSGRSPWGGAIERTITQAREAVSSALRDLGPGRDGALRPEHLMTELDAILTDDDIVVADASYATNWITSYLTARKPGMRFLTPRGLAGLGWGLPMALGAKLARPGARVFALVGDGGFGHCWSELETARRMHIPVVTMVLNNAILGYQTHAENVQYGRHTDACSFNPVDHAAIARACGCIGERVSSADEIGPALARAVACDGLVLLDVMTDPGAYPPLSLYTGKNPTDAERESAS